MDHLNHTSIQKNIDFVLKSQWWKKEEIENYQNDKLRILVKHCYDNVPYYKKLFKKLKLIPDDLKTRTDLVKLPKLTKEIIKSNFEDLKAVNINQFKPKLRRTGGTTGIPHKYFSDKQSWELGWALKYRDWARGGYNFGEKMALMGGASLIPNQRININRVIWNKINGFIPFSMTNSDNIILEKYFSVLIKKRIKFLRGYPSSLYIFAEFLKNKGINYRLKAIFTTAEVLLNYQRELIEEVFQCKVFDQYGCADASGHASECDHHNGHHISFEPSILEIVDDNFNPVIKGQEGEMIFTSLTNFAMPTIRYAPEDFGILSTTMCSCKTTSLTLKKITGRTTDIISFSNGRKLSGPAFTLIFRKFNLKQYQLVQKHRDTLNINLVKAEYFSQKEENEIINIMKFHCGYGVNIKINYLDKIESTKSGKFRFIISELYK